MDRRTIVFPNPQSDAMEQVLGRLGRSGHLPVTVEQIRTLRQVALLYEPRAVDFGYDVAGNTRIYFEDGYRVVVTPGGALT